MRNGRWYAAPGMAIEPYNLCEHDIMNTHTAERDDRHTWMNLAKVVAGLIVLTFVVLAAASAIAQ